MNTFLIDVAVGATGTLVAGAAGYFLWEKFFPMPNLSGAWEFRTNTQDTSYGTFANLWLCYEAHLLQDGTTLNGTGEKTREKPQNGEAYSYERDKRVRIELTGSVRRKGFRTFEVNIHHVEAGRERDTSWSHQLHVVTSDRLEGTFVSTAANQTGRVTWDRAESQSREHP